MSDPYALDRDGKRVYVGDYVQCISAYPSMPRGQRRRVLEIRPYDCISLGNGQSPVGVSDYKADRFRLAGRHHPAHYNAAMRQMLDNMAAQQETTTMLHIAVQWRAGTTMDDMASFLQNASSVPIMFAGTTKDEIQGKIRARLHNYPDEQWIILSGNTIGERADPPVRFRSL